MATIKSYTDIEQSKKLAEILTIESADMYYPWDIDSRAFLNIPIVKDDSYYVQGSVPCWSLVALLNILPDYNLQRTDWGNNKTEYKIVVTINDYNYVSKNYDNPFDAVYELILKLNELNLL